MSDLASRYRDLEARIARACERCARPRESVTLIGASKTHPAETLRLAFEAGLRAFGENRVQEGLAKAPELPTAIDWHLLGPLQSNKVRSALDLFRTFHAIDRPKIALALDAEAARRSLAIGGFLEVNLGGEASKHGFAPEELADSAAPLAALPALRVVGLMAIPPPSDAANRESARPWFRRLRELRDRLAQRPEWAHWPGHLSMGMSDDFEVAIEEGATHVRVGTALFGSRDSLGSRGSLG